MKKTTLILLTLALTLTFGTISAAAVSEYHGSRYTDQNHGSVCDNSNENCSFTGEDTGNLCAEHGESCNFTDEDHDGICDKRSDHDSGNSGNSTHHGQGSHNGNGHHGKHG